MENNNQNINDPQPQETVDMAELINTEKEQNPKAKKTALKIVLAAALCVAVVLIGFGIFAAVEINGKTLKEDITVDIPQGMYSYEIAEKLSKKDVIGSSFLFKAYIKLNGYGADFKYGTYTFSGKMSYKDIAEMLIKQGAVAQSVTVTIPEGTGINDFIKNVNGQKVVVPGIATLLENAGVCTRADFLEALDKVSLEMDILKYINTQTTYYPLEGYLFPETYDFYSYDSKECAYLAVKRMVEETEKRFTEEMRDRAAEVGYNYHEILTMASIIQMEAGQNTSEMKNVAGVFYNRLGPAVDGTLGSSPTCFYGNSFENDDERYDTYYVNGFPPGPMCSPGIDAINAALYPTEDLPYYYFVTDKNGKFYYHTSLSEQQNTINYLQQGNNWVYEYFD